MPRGTAASPRDEFFFAEQNARLVKNAEQYYRRGSHYFNARLSRQFDFVLHFDETQAVEPLKRTAGWEAGEVAETFPTGL